MTTQQQQHLPLGSSYYSLYSEESRHNIRNNKISPRINTSISFTSTPNQNEKDPESSSSFWQEFEWTETDKQNVIQLLQHNQQKCNVIENAITAQRGQYIIDKYEKDAQLHWNNFYTSHETKFFKDRHYLNKAFPDEFSIVYAINSNRDDDNNQMVDVETKIVESDENFVITEIGCGVGNTVLPLLELDPFILTTPTSTSTTFKTNQKNNYDSTNTRTNETKSTTIIKEKKKLVIWGLDFSSVAIDLLQKDKRYINATSLSSTISSSSTDSDRARAQVWDITTTHPKDIVTTTIHPLSSSSLKSKYTTLPKHDNQLCLESSSDISLLLFVLSAISPSKMKQAAHNVARTLKPGGILLLRDYGRYDEAQIKLGTSRNKRLGDNFYVKNDNTRCYYFSIEDVRHLFGSCHTTTSSSSSSTVSNDNGDDDCDDGAGLEILELKYIQRVYRNRADEASRRRVWVQGRFRKPLL
jgi:tRNAThr (cytosine32-N3)-methyltransferase